MADVEPKHIKNLMIHDLDSFVEDWHVRVTWIAFITLWVFWGLTLILRNFLGSNTHAVEHHPHHPTVEGAEVSEKPKFTSAHLTDRLNRAHQVVKDALFSLLCLLVVNSFARASTRAVMILAWFFTAFAIFWCLVELVIDNRFVRLIYSLIFYGLGLAILGLAFKQGFY
ncbi:hypothetical protein BY458DRAFT_507776 [Sporodiniella umbellata]|nr:hypothetical protein BY458DRAFT_507776 [Sporodiniella umbellata]